MRCLQLDFGGGNMSQYLNNIIIKDTLYNCTINKLYTKHSYCQKDVGINLSTRTPSLKRQYPVLRTVGAEKPRRSRL